MADGRRMLISRPYGAELSSKGLGRELGRWGSCGWRRFENGVAKAGDLAGGSELLELGLPLAQGRRRRKQGEEREGADLEKLWARAKDAALAPRMAGTWPRGARRRGCSTRATTGTTGPTGRSYRSDRSESGMLQRSQSLRRVEVHEHQPDLPMVLQLIFVIYILSN